MNKKLNKNFNRITKRRIENINLFKPIARIFFNDWLLDSGFAHLEGRKREDKFSNFFAEFLGAGNNNNWRQYSSFRRSISDQRVIYIEDKFQLPEGLIDCTDKTLVTEAANLTKITILAEKFNLKNKLNLSNEQIASLVSSLAPSTSLDQQISDDVFFRHLKV